MSEKYFIDILTEKNPTVFYTGFPGNVVNRVNQHRLGTASKFTKKYNIYKVVSFQETGPRTKGYAGKKTNLSRITNK